MAASPTNPRLITPLRAGVAVVWLLLVVAGLAGGGIGAALVMLALPAFVIGMAALAVGRARWAFLPNRKAAGTTTGVAVVLLLVSSAFAPPPQPVAAPPGGTTTTAPPTTTAPTTTALPTTVPTTSSTTTPTTTGTTTTSTTAVAVPAPTTTRTVRTRTTTNPPPAPRTTTTAPRAACDPSYPTICIPAGAPDLDCKDIPHRRFTVRPPDPHNFDGGNKNGIGCESG